MSENEQSPKNILLSRLQTKETPKEPTQEEPRATENAEMGPKGYPRPALEVTYSPDYLENGPASWTIVEGKDDNRHYAFLRNDPVDRIKAKMRGFQPVRDKNITTGFDDRPSEDDKIFGDLILMETSRDHWERLKAKKHEDANAWKKPLKKIEDEMMIDSIVETVREKMEAIDSPDGSGKKIWGFPNNPLGK